MQPGGSVRDAEVIAAADEHGLAMVFTGGGISDIRGRGCFPQKCADRGRRSVDETAPTSVPNSAVSVENTPVPLLLLALPVFFLALGANSIWDANEAFYVETPRQMVQTGDYVNPTLQRTASASTSRS